MNLKKGGSEDIKISDSGEGCLFVSSDGKLSPKNSTQSREDHLKTHFREEPKFWKKTFQCL